MTPTVAALHQPDLLPTPPPPLSNLQNSAGTSRPYNLAAPQHQTTTQQHHLMPMMTPMPTTLTPPTIMIDTSSITEVFLRHHKTLDHLKENLQQLSQSMAKTNAVLDCINQLLQPTTQTKSLDRNLTRNPNSPQNIPSPAKTTHPQQSPASASLSSIRKPRVPPKPPNLITTHNPCPYGPTDNQSMANTPAQLIAVKATSNPTSPSSTPSNAKPSYTQQSPATLSLNSIQSSRIPAPPLDPNAIPKHPTDTSDNNNTRALWPCSPCPATPAPPFLLKPMITHMRYKPQPSRRFLIMLSRMAKNNYRPP